MKEYIVVRSSDIPDIIEIARSSNLQEVIEAMKHDFKMLLEKKHGKGEWTDKAYDECMQNSVARYVLGGERFIANGVDSTALVSHVGYYSRDTGYHLVAYYWKIL